tara:strand:- start:2378 stop:2965 length:588 start_codon:yes stop_codon:yes gene_type:complete
MTVRKRIITAIAGMCICLSLSTGAMANTSFSLEGTPFEIAARQQGMDPTLLYALTLIESNDTAPERGIKRGFVAPWPYTLRAPDRAYRFDTRAEAEAALKRLIKTTESVDIGWAQINWYWHKDQVTSLEDLLDPTYNLEYAAKYLTESMALAPNDPALGIGFYHNRGDKRLARNYGSRVLAVQKNLKRMGISGGE